MAFIQIIDYHTSKSDEMPSSDEWEAATKGKATVRRVITCQDRNDPTHFQTIAFFDSYEDAMTNSNLPETSAMAEKMQALVDGPPTFVDLDVTDDRTL